MKVFKFGGASVKDAHGVKNLADIIKRYDDKLIVVVSAMGKTTNSMERLLGLWFNRQQTETEAFYAVKNFHYSIIRELFTNEEHPIYKEIGKIFEEIHQLLNKAPKNNYDQEYDRLVSYGEILSTKIIHAYLNQAGIENKWIDARTFIKTDSTFREARIDWDMTTKNAREIFTFKDTAIYLTQGFLGSTQDNKPTTLGREGSDFTASIIAYVMDCNDVTIWKDVPGVLNADPKWFDDTVKLDVITYQDAIELTYYGASIIHPKTIKPLQNKNIELHVRSFNDPDAPGTVIKNASYDKLVPSFIFKMDQVLIKISPRDFSFIAEENLKDIFKIISESRMKINLMQNSAISFRICTNNDPMRLPGFIKRLEDNFTVDVVSELELITIRYYDDKTIKRVLKNKELILEQITEKTIQMVVRDKSI